MSKPPDDIKELTDGLRADLEGVEPAVALEAIARVVVAELDKVPAEQFPELLDAFFTAVERSYLEAIEKRSGPSKQTH